MGYKQRPGRLEKVWWKDVRQEVHTLNPAFAQIIDDLDPGKDHWFARVSYPYGSMVMQRALLNLPNKHGDLVPITDPSVDSEMREALSYNLNSNPVSFVLKNSFEIYLPLKDRTISLTGLIQPGAVFGAGRILNLQQSEQPVFIWDMSAGARSVFMLPKITEAKKHLRLKKAYDLNVGVPRSLMDHWEIFRQLSNHPSFQEPWEAEILYFPLQWFTHLDDPKWRPFYYHFHNAAWGGGERWRNKFIWDLIFSLILEGYETRPNADIMDTVKYLLFMRTGVSSFSGLAPVRNELPGPFKEIQRIYMEDYDIRNYPPIIMQPEIFRADDPNAAPVYYSLQFPNALEFKPSSRIRASTISDLHEIRSLMIRCEQDLLSDKFNLTGTSLQRVFQRTQYDYFHNGVDLHTGMRNSAEMPSEDPMLITTLDGNVHKSFPDSSSFVKGCIRLSPKKT